MNKRFLLGIMLGLMVVLAYALRHPLQRAGFPFDPYFAALVSAPIILLALKKISLADMGFTSLGHPLCGLFFILLLPGILYLRLKLVGASFQLPAFIFPIIIGSLAEEFFFRGYLQRDFEKLSNVATSFIMTNVFFTLVHVVKGYSLLPSLMIFAAGMYFSFARHEKGGGSLVYPMITHVLYNIVASSMLMARSLS